jgi:hypothetical protein
MRVQKRKAFDQLKAAPRLVFVVFALLVRITHRVSLLSHKYGKDLIPGRISVAHIQDYPKRAVRWVQGGQLISLPNKNQFKRRVQ